MSRHPVWNEDSSRPKNVVLDADPDPPTGMGKGSVENYVRWRFDATLTRLLWPLVDRAHESSGPRVCGLT